MLGTGGHLRSNRGWNTLESSYHIFESNAFHEPLGRFSQASDVVNSYP